jgi:hypothetical protein
MNETDSHHRKHDEPIISISRGIVIWDEPEKLRINLWSTTSSRKVLSKTNLRLSGSIKQFDKFTQRNADPSIDWTWDGITIDWSDEYENASHSIRINREFDLNEIDESDLHHRKHDEPRFSTLLGITIDW